LLKQKMPNSEILREPGGTVLGEQLRNILLNPESKIDPRADVFLFMAARAQLHEERIKPLLAEGKTVIMDRWAWSTYAYQHILSMQDFERMLYFATDRWPDITFILDAPTGTSLARIADKSKDRFERRGFEFHQRVRHRYRLLDQQYTKIHYVDATQSVEEVHKAIRRRL
jgi:dTMP kinase